jgi:hypothetical protein
MIFFQCHNSVATSKLKGKALFWLFVSTLWIVGLFAGKVEFCFAEHLQESVPPLATGRLSSFNSCIIFWEDVKS